jgi:methylthioribose-1-phosphate isomerase
MTIRDGLTEIPIEERDQNEVRYITGKRSDGQVDSVLICPETTSACNYGFDVTPSKYITALITERGVCSANEQGIVSLFPEYSQSEGV